MALMRLDNPDLSLKELAEMFEPQLSKSGANHRLKRLVDIANDI
ncbi:MAG: helix-turn-helix domain-containing protein [Eubacterium sp.]